MSISLSLNWVKLWITERLYREGTRVVPGMHMEMPFPMAMNL